MKFYPPLRNGLLLALLGVSSISQASNDEWASVRALGMGNAYAAVVSDSDALFYNPASLCRISSFTWTILDPRFGVDGFSAISAAKQINADKGSAVQLANYLQTQYGQNYWAGAGLKTALTLPCVGVGFFGSTDLQFSVESPPNYNVEVDYYADYGFIGGFALPLDEFGLTTLGIVGKRINRVGSSQVINDTTLATSNFQAIVNSIQDSGVGYGVDVGFNLSIPLPSHPTLSAVYHNVGTTSFSHTSGPSAPSSMAPNLVAGAGLEFNLPLITITPAAEVDYLETSGLTLTQKLHAGLEVSIPLFDFRGGFSEGYYTAGAGIDIGLIRLDAVTYAEKLGTFANNVVDRRYMAQATFELSLPLPKFAHKGSGDPDGPDGVATRRLHLKERR